MLRRSLVTAVFVTIALGSPLYASFDRSAEAPGRARIVSVSNTPGTVSALSELAADGDKVFLLWREGEREIRLRRSADRGATFRDGPSGHVIASAPRGESVFALRAAASGGRMAILFTSGTTPELAEVSVMVSTDGGATFGVPVRFERSGGSPNAGLAIDDAGRFHVVMEDRGATDRILYLLSVDGQSFSERVVSETAGTEPRLAAWRHRVGVVWADATGEVLFATSSDSGATFTAAVNVSRSEARSTSPDIAAGDSIHIVWNEGGALVHTRSKDLGASFAEAVTLADATDPATRVAVAGSAVRVTWTSGGRSFLRRSSTNGDSFAEAVELTSGLGGESFGGVAIIPSSFDSIAWPHTKTRAPRDAEVLFIQAANALVCANSWKDPVNGNWNEAAKWSGGVVPVAGANACITVDGIYTVNVTASHATATLQVGNPANLIGQPTLVVQSTLNVSGELVNDGFIRLDHPTTGTATLVASPLTNNKNFEVAPGNALVDGTAIVNDGVYSIKGIQTMNTTAQTFTNRGTFTIDPGSEMRPRHNFRFHQNAGVFRSLGLPLNISSSNVDADIFFFNGGSVEGTVLITGRGGFAFGADATGPIDFEVHTGGPSIWYSGNSHPGQSIRLISRNVSSALEIWSNVTNGGTLRLDSLAGSIQGVDFGIAQGATTLTNTGRIEVGNTSPGASKTFRVPLIINSGIIDVRDDLAIAGTDNVLTNTGTFTSAAGTAITPGLRSVFNQNGGVMNVGGTFTVNSHFQGPCTFNYNGGNINGEVSITGTARLNLAAAAGSGRFLFTNGGFSTQGFLSGPIGANQEIIIRALGTTDAGHRQVDFAANVVNNGLIRLESAAGSNRGTEVVIPTGTLINNNRIELVSDSIADADVRRAIRGSVTNHGQLVIGDHANLTGTLNVIVNDGSIDIAAGTTVRLGDGTRIDQNAGTLNILGTLWAEGPPRQHADFLNYNGGSVSGEVYIVGSSGLHVGAGAAGSGVFFFRSTEGLEGRTPSLSGNVVPGQTIILRGEALGPAGIVMNGNVGNGGLILFDNVGTSGKGAGITITGDAVLTNTGTIRVTASAPAAFKSISGHVTNNGSIEIHDDFTIGGTSRTLTNNGTLTVFAGDLTLGVAHLVVQQAGTMRVDGRFLIQQGGNQGPDWFVFNGGQVLGSGDVMLTEACQLHIGPGSTGAGRFVFGPGNGVFAGNIAPAQTVMLLGSTGGVNVTAANGFINAGRLVLDTTAASTQGVGLNVTAGTLTNRGTLTVGGANLASNKVLNLVLNNEGRFEVLDTLTLSRTSASHANSGTVHIASGQVLTVAGSSTLTNPGGGFEGGGQFTLANLSSFTGFGALGVNVRNEGRMEPTGLPRGVFDITGTYTQTTTGRLDMNAGAAGQHDQVNVSGSATLAGTLNASLFANTCPAGDYPILTYASLVGDFTTKTLNAGAGRTFTTVPGTTSYLLRTNGPPCNTAPIAVSDSYTANAGVPLDVAAPGVLGNDTDGEGNPLTAILVAGPSSGALTLNSNGSIRYTPGAVFIPIDSFTYKASDGLLDSNVATVTINIIDTLAPVTVAQVAPGTNANGWHRTDVTVTLTATDSGSGVRDLRYRINGGTEQIVTGSPAVVSFTTEGVHTFTFFATDHAANSEPVQSITIRIDKTAPVLTAPANVSQGTGPNAATCSANIGDGALGIATATDNLSTAALTRSGVPAANIFPLGSTTITHTATDAAGNSSTALQTVTVVDDTPPVLQVPAAVTRPSAATSCNLVIADADLGSATASDNCPGVNVTRSGVPAGNVFPVGATTITYTATDAAGNSTTATQIVTVTDNTPPALQAPAAIARTSAANACDLVIPDADLGTATASDNCPGSVTITRSGVPAGNVFPVGATTVTYTAADAAGNTSTATQIVMITDNTSPSIQAPASITRSSGATCDLVLNEADLGSASATDNCGGVSVSRSGVPANHLFSLGTHTITYTATDAAGNVSTATQTIVVTDTAPPVISCAANITVSAGAGSCSATVTVARPAASDSCSNVSVSASRSDGAPLDGPYPVGTTTIRWIATDGSGNSASCTQTVTVVDDQQPVISGASATPAMLPGDGVMHDVTVGYTTADNCGISGAVLSVTSSDGASAGIEIVNAHLVRLRGEVAAGSPERQYTITITATDIHGNTATRNLTVIVRAAVQTGPCAILRQAEQQLLALIAVSTPKAADKLEDALAKLRSAIAKCSQVPPDRQGVLGELEGAAGDLEAAIKDRLITSAQGTPILQLFATAARFFTAQAIDEAIARGANKGQITAAQALLKVGDGFVANGRFKDAIAKFKDALSKVE